MSDHQGPESAQPKRLLLRNELIADALLDPGECTGMGLPATDESRCLSLSS